MRPQHGTLAAERPTREPLQTFEEFFIEHYEQLLRAMYLLTGNPHEAEELAQEPCFRVFERWERLRETAYPAGYAYRVALNAHRSRLRRLAVAIRKTIPPGQPDQIGASDERDAIRRALARPARSWGSTPTQSECEPHAQDIG